MSLTGQVGAGWPALAALAIGVLIACMGDPQEITLHGTVRPSCGPADGPALEIRASEDGGLSCVDKSEPLHRILMDYPEDSLKAGKVLEHTLVDCSHGECGPKTTYKLEIRSADSAEVRGTLEINRQVGKREVHEAVFKRCPKVIQFCG